MTIGTEDKTPVDGIVELDYQVERTASGLGDNDKTPVPTPSDVPTRAPAADTCPCFACPVTADVLPTHVLPPGCEAEARGHYDSCAQGAGFSLCAAKFLIKVGSFVWYFGPERRTKVRPRPEGLPDRRRSSPAEGRR